MKSDEKDLADVYEIKNYWAFGGSVAIGELTQNFLWGLYNIYPKDANGNFENNFPKIMSMGVDLSNTAKADFSILRFRDIYVKGEDADGNFSIILIKQILFIIIIKT